MTFKFKDITVSSEAVKVVKTLEDLTGNDNVEVQQLLSRLGMKSFLTAAPQSKFEQFFNNQAKIFFVCDYIINEEFIGVLLVFQRYPEATHYEIFKKNKFDNEPKFERILFLDSHSLAEETNRFLFYLESAGLSFNENAVFAILDDNVKVDRIYEFFIRAVFVPTKVEAFDIDANMRSKNQVETLNISDDDQLISLFSSRPSWLLPIFNSEIPFFNKKNTELEFSDIPNGIIFCATKNEDVMQLIKDAIYLFGAKKTLLRLIDLMNKKDLALSKPVRDAFSVAIDEQRGVFSFSIFQIEIAKKLSIKVLETGSVSFNSFDNLTKIFNVIKSVDGPRELITAEVTGNDSQISTGVSLSSNSESTSTSI